VNPDHLFLGTQADNMADKVRKGRQATRGRHGHTKITVADLQMIRQRRAAGETFQRLAEDFGVSAPTVWYALRSKVAS
jgi:hypothetical protein